MARSQTGGERQPAANATGIRTIPYVPGRPALSSLSANLMGILPRVSSAVVAWAIFAYASENGEPRSPRAAIVAS